MPGQGEYMWINQSAGGVAVRGFWHHQLNPFGKLDAILFLGVEEPVQPANDPDLFGPRYRHGAHGYGGFHRYFLGAASHLQNAWTERDVRRGLWHGAPRLFPSLLAALQREYDLYAYRDPARVERLPRPLREQVVGTERYQVISFATGAPILLGRLLYRLPPAAELPADADAPLLGAGHLWDYLLALPQGADPFARVDWPLLAGVLTQAGFVWSEGGRSQPLRGEAAGQLPGAVWFAGVGALLERCPVVITLHEDWNGPPGGGSYVCLSTRLPLAEVLEELCRGAFPDRPGCAYRREDLREGFLGQEHWFDFFRPPFFKG